MKVATNGTIAIVALITAGLAVGCASTEIRPKPGSERVEITSKQQIGEDWGNQCKRLGNTTARVGPNPSSEGSTLSPAELEARNKAHTKGATHVAVGSEKSYACSGAGRKCSDCGFSCTELPATAYKCERGASEKGASASDESKTNKASNESASSGSDTLNIQAAANVCGVETEVIQNGVSSGNLNAIQTDDGYLMSRSGVIEFCASQQNQTETDDKNE